MCSIDFLYNAVNGADYTVASLRLARLLVLAARTSILLQDDIALLQDDIALLQVDIADPASALLGINAWDWKEFFVNKQWSQPQPDIIDSSTTGTS